MNFSLTNFPEKITNKQLLIAFVSLFILINIPYYWNFHSFNLSKSATDWGEYGSYISGFTSILNLFFFFTLTIYVARLGNKNSEAQISTQEKINELQISAQKKIMLAQLRQSELNKLNEILYKPLYEFSDGNFDEVSKMKFMNSIALPILKLKNFQNQQKYLYPILNNEFTKNIISKLNDSYEFIYDYLDNPNDKGNIIPGLEVGEVLKTLDIFNDIMQKFIIDELK